MDFSCIVITDCYLAVSRHPLTQILCLVGIDLGDVRRYSGHKAFIEFPYTGNGSVSIEDIRQTSEGSPREIPKHLFWMW